MEDPEYEPLTNPDPVYSKDIKADLFVPFSERKIDCEYLILVEGVLDEGGGMFEGLNLNWIDWGVVNPKLSFDWNEEDIKLVAFSPVSNA